MLTNHDLIRLLNEQADKAAKLINEKAYEKDLFQSIYLEKYFNGLLDIRKGIEARIESGSFKINEEVSREWLLNWAYMFCANAYGDMVRTMRTSYGSAVHELEVKAEAVAVRALAANLHHLGQGYTFLDMSNAPTQV